MELPQRNVDLSDIGADTNDIAEVTRPNLLSQLEAEELENARLSNKLARSRIKNVKADRNMRKDYASKIIRYLQTYSGGVLILLLLSGFNIWGFDLAGEVLLALVGSTALAAIGLVGFIAKGLFQQPPYGIDG